MENKRYVIFISDHFGYRCGGSNTVNYELCIAMRQITGSDVEIISLVFNCNNEDRVKELEDKAENLNIRIIHSNVMNKKNGMASNVCEDICRRIFQNDCERQSAWWIGHDVFTGNDAIRLALYSGGKCGVCIHTDYDTIEGLKDAENRSDEKEREQRKIIRDANKVFPIGPRLAERVYEVRKPEVYELIPGVSAFTEGDIYNNRAVITYGRFEGNVALVKQAHLALAAFGKAVAIMNNNRDYVMHVIGTPNREEERKLRSIAEKYAEGRKLSINFLPYIQDRKRLFSVLKNNCAGLMISISEGFGLTGWEMISAGIPLILTKKSGLYDYLVKRFGYLVNGMCLPVDLKGSSSDALCEEDVETVAQNIVTVFKNTDQLRIVASEMREQIRGETWHKAAGVLAKAINVETTIFGMSDIYSETYGTRQSCIEEILNRLEIDEMGENCLILFGGISQSLCGERAIKKIERWLRADLKRRLFICYESGEAALGRAKELDEAKMPKNDGLPRKPEERMRAKEELVKDSFHSYSEEVQNQVRLIELKNSLLTYVVVVDQDIYCTLLLETRSSEAMTMKLQKNSVAERKKVLDSMKFVLGRQNLQEPEKELLEVLKKIK